MTLFWWWEGSTSFFVAGKSCLVVKTTRGSTEKKQRFTADVICFSNFIETAVIWQNNTADILKVLTHSFYFADAECSCPTIWTRQARTDWNEHMCYGLCIKLSCLVQTVHTGFALNHVTYRLHLALNTYFCNLFALFRAHLLLRISSRQWVFRQWLFDSLCLFSCYELILILLSSITHVSVHLCWVRIPVVRCWNKL